MRRPQAPTTGAPGQAEGCPMAADDRVELVADGHPNPALLWAYACGDSLEEAVRAAIDEHVKQGGPACSGWLGRHRNWAGRLFQSPRAATDRPRFEKTARQVARGGHGQVSVGFDRELEREVALKEIVDE